MQGLFGRFGKTTPELTIAPQDLQAAIDELEFPITGESAADEETNWDEEEALDNFHSTNYPQPIVPTTQTLPVMAIDPDLEDWDEALPAATVKNSNVQEVRRSRSGNLNPKTKPATITPPTEDLWDENIPSVNFSSGNSSIPPSSKPTQIERAIGVWAATIQQLRRILPRQLRRLSDGILTAIVVAMITLAIWFVDSLLVVRSNSPVATTPAAAPSVVNANAPMLTTVPKTSPEQAFLEAIQTQLSDITSKYPDDIIQGLQVDLSRNRAIISLNPVWYLIDDQRQNDVTDKMWLQARTNHFTKLELQDAQGKLVARSPVVGAHLVILHRRQN